MKFISLIPLLFISSAVYAQQTLHEKQVEENLFLLKILGVVVLILIIMPIILRQLRKLAPETKRIKPLPVEEPQKKKKEPEPEELEEV